MRSYLRREIPPGRAAGKATLSEMASLVVRDATPSMRERALEIVSFAVSPMDQVEAVESWVRRHIVLVDESPETVTSPEAAMQIIDENGFLYGDCDDASTLAACLLYVIGFSVRFKAILPVNGVFTHVFVEYRYPGQNIWRPLDVTIPIPPLYTGGSLVVEI